MGSTPPNADGDTGVLELVIESPLLSGSLVFFPSEYVPAPETVNCRCIDLYIEQPIVCPDLDDLYWGLHIHFGDTLPLLSEEVI